jgi:OmcA/MtrC family decaheme c-type cytochrome
LIKKKGTSMFGSGERLIRLILIVFAASFLWACEGDDGDDGATGPQGPRGEQGLPGPEGPPADTAIQIGDGSAMTAEEVAVVGKLTAEITGVTVAGPPVVAFTVVDQNGNPAQGISGNTTWFTFAKLVPNTDPDVNGGLPYWQSYVNRVEDVANNVDTSEPPDGVPDRGSDALSVAVQATTDADFGAGDRLVETAPGVYEYTFGTDVTDVTDITAPIAVAWEPDLTHRVGLEIRLEGPGEVPLAPPNPVYDWVPNGGVVTTKAIADSANCYGCHYDLAIHGGPRKTVEYCVTCHNPGTVDQDTGESMDLAYLAHSIHMGEDRTDIGKPFVVYGYGERFGSANDFSEVTYPQSKTYCETCHEASLTAPDGDNWNADATVKTCGGCHANGVVAQNFDPVTGIAEYQFNHALAGADGIGATVNDGSCDVCHLGQIVSAGDALSIHSRISGDQRFREALGKDFVLEILDATNLGAGQTPVITFRVTDAAGTPYDIMTDPEFDTANGSSLNLYVAWPSIENYNGDELGATGGFRDRDRDTDGDGVADIEYYGAGHPNRMYLNALQRDIAANPGWVNADGSYTVTYFTALPDDFVGSAMVSLGGHPAAIGVEDADEVVGNQRAAAASFVYFPANAEREFAVDSDNCNACHKQLQFHGANRNENVEMCLNCHNADLADGDEGFALGYMIHSIHSSSTTFAGGEFEFVTYPQSIGNCETCHTPGSYNAARAAARAVSKGAGVLEDVWTDDPATTPTATACGTCHTSVAARGHFESQAGQVDDLKCTIVGAVCGDVDGATGSGLPNGQEACAVCHGAGSEFETAKYHNHGVGH